MKKTKILVVEDYIDNYILLQAQLRDYPYVLENAQNGQEALERIETDSFDLLLIDIQMPVLNGFELLEILKKNNNKIPTIAQTAHAFDTDRIECINAGFNGYISKPINKESLLELFAQLIH